MNINIKSRIPSLLMSLLLFGIALSIPSVVVKGANHDKEGMFTLIIDAGHGGKDGGACDNGVKEKDINLGVALQLEALIKEQLKDVRVVMTRSNDTFLSLQQRADKANSSHGNLFISIHTNSVDLNNPNRTTIAGSSVYVLGPQKDQNNMNVARRENSVINLERNHEEGYEGFDPDKDESYIIFEMAQKKNLSQSYRFAQDVQQQLVRTAKRADRKVHQAGFWVLWATSMPSVLIELDFITNPNSAKYIASETGQKQLAKAIFDAIENYVDNQKKLSYSDYDDINMELSAENISDSGNTQLAVVGCESRMKESRTVGNNAQQRVPSNSNRYGMRKRRSDYAREISGKRVVEVSDIHLLVEQPVASGTEMADNRTEVKNVTNREETGSGKDKTEKRKKDKVAETPDSSTHRHHRASLQKMHTVYQIRLLQSDKQLSNANPLFCGFRPESSFMENNLYNYTLGEASERSQLDELYARVKEVIPDAVVIKRTKSVVVR